MTPQAYYIIGGIVALAGAIWLNLIITHRYILKHKYINHSKHWWKKALASLPAVALFTLGVWQSAKPVFALGFSTALVIAWFMTFFDGIYGLRTVGQFFYAGTATGKMKSKTDRVFRSLPVWIRALIKIILCAGTLYAYIKLLEK
jgi:hypothetical protein